MPIARLQHIRTHDGLFKFVFGEPEQMAELLRACLPAKVAAAIDWSTLTRVPSSIVDKALEGRDTDLLFTARMGNATVLLYVVPEHKSANDRFASWQIACYVVRILEQWCREHDNATGLPAVLPLLVYHGDRPWDSPRSPNELVDWSRCDPALAAFLAPRQLQLPYLLLDLSQYDEQRIEDLRLSAVSSLTLRFLQFLRWCPPEKVAGYMKGRRGHDRDDGGTPRRHVERVPMTHASTAVVGRLAPSPTGALHLGNARTFLLAWLSVRSRGGTLRLRIEDIDGPRVKPEATAQTIDDLRWLGLDWDEEPLVQSTRLGSYADAAARLLAAGKAYPCVCTRSEVENAASAPHESSDDGPVYPGTCRGRFATREAAMAATGRDAALRFRVDVDAVPFADTFAGPQAGRIRSDFVVQKRDGGPAYQLAVVVDDAAQGVTEVLRADDLLPSTPRQLLLYRALGPAPPRFVHVPLLVGADGKRLAKRHGDTSMRYCRGRGVRAEQLVGHLAFLCDLRPRGAECTPGELVPDFDLARLARTPLRGDEHSLV